MRIQATTARPMARIVRSWPCQSASTITVRSPTEAKRTSRSAVRRSSVSMARIVVTTLSPMWSSVSAETRSAVSRDVW